MRVRLGNYIQEYSIKNKKLENIPVYSVTNTKGFCTEYFGKEVASNDKSAYKIVPQGYFAYNPSRINVGSVDWQRYEDRVIVSPLYVVFSVSEELRQQYLYYYLKSDIALQRIKAIATGSVRDNLKLSMLKEFEISIPSISRQDEIIMILDNIVALMQLQKEQMNAYDEIIKSRFVEMFGDPIENTMGWKVVTMKEICKKITDGEHGSVPRVEHGHPFLNAKHIKKDGIIDWNTVTYIDAEVHDKIYSRCNPEVGDILLTTTGTIGNVAIVPEVEPFSMDRGITLLKIDKEQINNVFLSELLTFECLQAVMNANVHASAIGHLFLNQVMKIPVIVPTIELQEEFAAFVIGVGKLKVELQKTMEDTQMLFDSLMQQYFG